MTRFRNQSEETEDYGITTQFTPDRFAVRELLALATVGVRHRLRSRPLTTVAQTGTFQYLKPVRPVIFPRLPSKQMVTPRAS